MIATSVQPILTQSTDSSHYSSGHKSLVHWLGRLVEKMASGSGRKDLEAVWVVASDLLYEEFIFPRPRNLSEQRQTWADLKALEQRHVGRVSIDHRV